MKATIDVSAQFGGRDAAAAVLPHFKAPKAAVRGGGVRDFPVRKLAFILRVDGEISQCGLSGPGNPDMDPQGEYISVDIGCTIEDRANLVERVASAIVASKDVLKASGFSVVADIDFDGLSEDLEGLVERYKASL